MAKLASGKTNSPTAACTAMSKKRVACSLRPAWGRWVTSLVWALSSLVGRAENELMSWIDRKLAALEWPWLMLALLGAGVVSALALFGLIAVIADLRLLVSLLGAFTVVTLLVLRVARLRKGTRSEWI